MKLIPRRKQSPTTFERAAGFLKLGAKGLAAQRVARRGLRTFKLTKRLVPLAALGAIGAAIAKKRSRGGDSAPSYSPPASTGGSAPTSAAAAATAATGTPPAEN
ncbi:MAG TPA: hypothetical protein VGW10_17110, partial [Solirubrobacteraceae bacterium]|nr:hypothetical protein [Solirubrobacteraceae bacterium]